MATSSDLPSTFQCTKPIDFTKTIDTSKLKGKSVIVTGGANGIGLACVTDFAKAGAYVTILDINEEKGHAAANSLTEKGYHVQFTPTDISNFSAQITGFKSAISFSPSHTIDIVLACAGLAGPMISSWLDDATSDSAPTDPSPPETRVIEVNMIGTLYTAHLALFYFKQTAKHSPTRDKLLMFVSSLAGYLNVYTGGIYSATKFGVRGLWKSLRRERHILGPDAEFRCNLIAPTFIETDMTVGVGEWAKSMGIESGQVEDVAAGVMRIVCDEDVRARALAIAPRKEVLGDSNFDLCDDWEGLDAGREFLAKIRDGTVKNLELFTLEQPRG